MFLILLFAFIGIIILSFFSPVTDFSQLVYIAIMSLFIAAFIIYKYPKIKVILLTGFFLRLVIMVGGYYGLIYVPFAGIDAIRFDSWALTNAQYGNYNLKLTNYTTFLTTLYLYLGHAKLIAQYINVIFGTGVLFILYDIFKEEKIDQKIIKKLLLISVFFPILIIFSAVLLREAWCQFFVALSLLYFLRWMRSGNIKSFLLSILCILISSWMHSGCLFIALGYFIAVAIYQPRKQVNKFSFGSLFFFFLFFVGILVLLTTTDMFTDKLDRFDEDTFASEGLYSAEFTAGSAYLTWINPNSPFQLLLFAPLKMFYFMFSSLPWNWRGLFDIISFLFDGVFYLCFLYFSLKYTRKNSNRITKNQVKYIFTSLLFSWFVFAYGTSNSGTAIRHRAKLFPLVITMYALSTNSKKNRYIDNRNMKSL